MASLLRIILATSVLGGLIMVGYWKLSADREQRLLEEIAALNLLMEERLAERQEMIDRLSRSRRVAHVHVAEQWTGPGGDVDRTDLLFIELDEHGSELARQDFTIPGDVLFVDAWTVKFDHEFVAAGHPLFGRSLVLFRRIYSDRMAPIDGFPIDTPGAIPPGYATSEIGTFEQHLWSEFWRLATDADLAASLGVRVAQGEAVYKPVVEGHTYELLVDAVGGISLRPLPTAERVITQAERR